MRWIATWTLAALVSAAAVANEPATMPELTAAQIVEKNVAARGGLDAWKKIQTMVWLGHIESANAPAPNVAFVLELKRPNKERFEIRMPEQTSVRMYDGSHGWKLRPGANGRPEVQPYTPQELAYAREGEGLDDPLIDSEAKGLAVALDGVDEVEGRKAYRLNVTLASGNSQHVWVDAQTFLDIKYDRLSRNASGMSAMVSVFNRDYRTVAGLQVPFLIESGAGTAQATGKLVIDKVLLNPPLDDRLFAKPNLSVWRSNMDQGGSAARQPAHRTLRPPTSP